MVMNKISELLLRRRYKIDIGFGDFSSTSTKQGMVISIVKNVNDLGFTFDSKLMNRLVTFGEDEIICFYSDLMIKLKPLVGADKKYNPMYPNFPKQVMNADDGELFWNAIMHYYSGGTLLPRYERDERFPLFDENKITVLSVGTDADILEIFTDLVQSKTSLSQQDKDDMAFVIRNYPQYADALPNEIPLKENVAMIGKIVIEQSPIKDAKCIQKYFKTATDILRLIVAMSDGDISLAKPTKIRKISRPERRMIMNLLAGIKGDITEDLFRYRMRWVHSIYRIHPFTYREKMYRRVNIAFRKLRDNDKPLMFGGKVQNALSNGDTIAAAELLKQRPGEFARRLDDLLRDTPIKDRMYIINSFKSVADSISTTVLLQVRQHFMGRFENNQKDLPVRVFFPKGNLAKAISIANNLPAIGDDYCRAVVTICENALIGQYKMRDFMGKVYVDPALKSYLVPFSQRSASKTSKVIVRGSRIPIDDKAQVIRGFIWWTNMGDYSQGNRVDIDLSAAIYDENWRYISHIGWTNLKSDTFESYHSGDIVNGGDVNGNGGAEFIDFDISAIAKRARYVAFQIYSYTGQKFSNMPNARFGWMPRQNCCSGEIFEPKTVEISMDITSESTNVVPVIFDCITREFIWCDMAMRLPNFCGGCIENTLSAATAACFAMTHLNKTSIYDLVMLNVKARGILTEDRSEADIIFSNDTTVPTEDVKIQDLKTGKNVVIAKEKDVSIIRSFDSDYFAGQLI